MAIKAEDIPVIARGIFRRYKIQIIIIIAVLIVGIMAYKLITGKKDKADPENYRVVTDIPGIEFMMEKSILNTSTAIADIEESLISISDNQAYVYKNGIDTYTAFNMRSYFNIVKKDAKIDLAHSDMSNVCIDNVWFSKQDPKDKVKTHKNVSSIPAIASVSYSASLYNDFYGTLTSVVDTDGTEYVIFFGVTKNLLNQYYTIVDYTTASLILNSENTGESRDIAEIDIDSGEVIIPEGANVPVPESASEETDSEVAEPSDVDSENNPVEEPEEPSAPEEPTPEPVEEPEPEPASEPELETPQPEPAEETVVNPEPTTDVVSVPVPEPVVYDVEPSWMSLNIYNGEEIEQTSTDRAYSSNSYDMLKPGKAGSMQLINENSGSAETGYVRVTKIFNAAETQTLVDDYVKSGLSYYSDFKAPQSCHLEAVKYDLRYATTVHSCVDVKITGLDGYNLIFRGTMYDTRAYAIKWFGGEEENDWYKGYVAFYIVPDGCVDYALKFGGSGESGRIGASWYKIEL